MTSERALISVENINCPGQTYEVLLGVLPAKSPVITQKEMFEAIKPHLPQEL